ncbi:MAG: extracellular solute-binding protein [Bdellovibrionales bacterium]
MRFLATFLAFFCFIPAAFAAPQHAIALHGQPKYAVDFKHLDYVNPDAPKGGSQSQAAFGTFDNLNPFILKGISPSGLGDTFATLTTATLDEPFSAYGYVAESIDLAPDRKSVTFRLRDIATFHDGTPITADDVAWSFDALKTKGHPLYRIYYHDVTKAEALDKRTVKFTFASTENRELPLIIGQLPVLSKTFFAKRAFDQTTLDVVLGSGPYKVSKIEAGRTMTYERVKGWWGENLPIFRGRHNFDIIREDFYRDYQVAFEAFAAGKLDFRRENMAKSWAQAYNNIPAYKQGKIIKKMIPLHTPAVAQGFVYNTRRELFNDRRVRRALTLAFDFEWANKTLAFGAYTRQRSYFDNSELAATGVPEGRELALLEPFRNKLPPEVFTAEFQPPKTDGSGNNRANMKKALELLNDAGWKMDGTVLKNAAGKSFAFDMLVTEKDGGLERWIQPWLRNLERLGIKVSIRQVDSAQFVNRVNDFDFDVIIHLFPQSLSPGNEQRDFWGSDKASMPGSKNLIGVADPVVDAMIEEIIRAETREDLVAAVRALDRTLQWGYYILPNWYIGSERIAYWDKFGFPPNNPPYGVAYDTWWAK